MNYVKLSTHIRSHVPILPHWEINSSIGFDVSKSYVNHKKFRKRSYVKEKLT